MKKLTVRGISTHEESKGEWKYGYLIEDEGVSYIINGVAEANDEYISIGEWCSVDPETLGLSTGLSDENGVEIFEGDILARNGRETLSIVRRGILYSNLCFYIEVEHNGVESFEPFNPHLSHFHTIVGNVYENPELLEE